MFGKGVALFKLFGFEVRVDFSWAILAVLITWTLAQGLFPHYYPGFNSAFYWLMGAAGAVGLFISIVFHEFCHSIVARRYGLPMEGITLFIFGGVAHMSDEPPSPKVEFLMAVAGPLSSILLGGMLLGCTSIGSVLRLGAPVLGVMKYLSYLNFALAGFNLLPAFPLDGGRVLRSLLWAWKNDIRWATRIASKLGTAFGVLLVVFGVLNVLTGSIIGGIWYFLIGLFLRNASLMSYQQLIVRRALEGEPVWKFMVSKPVTVSPYITIQDLVDNYIYRHHYKMFPVLDNGRLLGCVTLNQVKDIPAGERAHRTVMELARSCSPENTIHPDEDVIKAFSVMKKNNASRLMVTRGDRLVGIIALKDIMKMLSIKMDLDAR